MIGDAPVSGPCRASGRKAVRPAHVRIPEECMRRFVFVAAVVTLAAACGTPAPEVGEHSVRFASPPPADSALNRAAAALAELGFTVGCRHENLIFTTPQPLPAGARVGGVANDTTAQLWFLHVTADDRLFRGGSNTTVRAFLIPSTGNVSPGNVVQENALPVNSDRPEAFRELRRSAEQLHTAAMRR